MRIRICAQCQNWHMLRARRCPPSGLHMQHPKHMGSREESMQRHNPMVDMGSRMDFPPRPIPTVQLEPRAPSAASRSAPAQRLLPCTSGTGLPRTAGGRWPGSSSHRTGSCLRGRELCSPRARGAPHHRVPRAQPGAPTQRRICASGAGLGTPAAFCALLQAGPGPAVAPPGRIGAACP